MLIDECAAFITNSPTNKTMLDIGVPFRYNIGFYFDYVHTVLSVIVVMQWMVSCQQLEHHVQGVLICCLLFAGFVIWKQTKQNETKAAKQTKLASH